MLSDRMRKRNAGLNNAYEYADEVAQLEADKAVLEEKLRVSEEWSTKYKDHWGHWWHKWLGIKHRLRPALNEAAALEAQVATLREALTDDGKLTPHHFRTWSGALEEEQRYESRLTQWLKIVADALESLDA